MIGPIQQSDVEAMYAEHRRQMAWINEHDWKHDASRPLRTAIAKALVGLARRIAPPTVEREHAMDTPI